MQQHQLKPIHKSKTKKRVGRGGKKGTYSGRGIKGQGSRAGRKMQPIIRELIKRYPKLRGYRQNFKRGEEIGLNLSVLDKNFEDGSRITPKVLYERKIIKKNKSKIPSVRILAMGNINKKIIIEGCKVSKGAKEKIEKAGGEVKMTND